MFWLCDINFPGTSRSNSLVKLKVCVSVSFFPLVSRWMIEFEHCWPKHQTFAVFSLSQKVNQFFLAEKSCQFRSWLMDFISLLSTYLLVCFKSTVIHFVDFYKISEHSHYHNFPEPKLMSQTQRYFISNHIKQGKAAEVHTIESCISTAILRSLQGDHWFH